MRHPGILNDILFKIVYGSKSGEPLLSHLLNALLELKGGDEIVDLELLNPIIETDFIDEKGPVLDVKARDRNTVDLPESLVQEEGIQLSLERMRRAYARDEVRELIEAREKAERDEISRMRTAEARGLKKGTERGLKQGMKQGLEQGLERGRREVALGLLRQGVAMEIIENATGLSRKQIEALK